MRLLSTLALALGLATASLALPALTPVAHAQQAAKKASQRIQGDWKVHLPPAEAQMADAMRLIIRDPPPTEAELGPLSAENREMVVMGREMAKTNPELMQEARAAVELADSMRMTITADTLELQAGPEKQVGKYTVQSETADSVKLEVVQDGSTSHSEMRLVSDDELHVYEGGVMAVQATRIP